MNLAVLDWVSPLYFRLPMLTIIIVCVNFYFQNENVQRGHRMYIDMRRPNRRTPLRVLVDKLFVEDVWCLYMTRNMQVTGYVNYNSYIY